MISVKRILAGITPADMHFARRQVNYHGIDGLLAVKRVGPINSVITNRIRVVDMILLNRLQTLDGMRLALT